jgi:hypothetical protein
MNQSIIRSLTVAALVAYPAFALGADQVPDIKGKWIGKTHTIIVARAGIGRTAVEPGTNRPCSKRIW